MILGVTGSIMEFEPELDRLLHPQLSYVTPRKKVLSLGEIGNMVSRKFSGESVVAYSPSLSPSLSTQVILPSGIVYVDQYTGEVLGERARGQTFLGYVRALHVRLGSGDIGRNILKWSAIAMLMSLASGLYLWWPIKQIRVRGKWGSRKFWFNLHSAIGILSLLPLAMLATTGAVLGFNEQLAPMIYRMTDSHPIQVSRSAIREGAPDATSITPDEAVSIAQACVPNASPYRVQMPEYGGTYQIALVNAHDKVTGDRNLVVLDRHRGNVVSLTRSSDLSRGDRILALNEAIHTGSAFGMPGRITACLASITVFAQASSGLLMWLYRKKIIPSAGRFVKGESVS